MTVSTVDIANENLTPEMKTAIRRLEKLAAATSPSTGQGVTYSAMMGHTLVDDSDITTLAQLDILSQEARVQAQQLGKDEARNLVDSYYEAQERRKASSNHVRSLGASGEPVMSSASVLGIRLMSSRASETGSTEQAVARASASAAVGAMMVTEGA